MIAAVVTVVDGNAERMAREWKCGEHAGVVDSCGAASAWARTLPNPRTSEHAAIGRPTRMARCRKGDDVASFSLSAPGDALARALGMTGCVGWYG